LTFIDTLKKQPLQGTITLPGDKSITHRAIILSALASGTSEIVGYLPSQDCEQTLQAFKMMGIRIAQIEGHVLPRLKIEGKGSQGLSEPNNVIDCGNSGTTMRLMTGLLAGQSFFSVLTGDDSLRNRPMRRIVDPLRMMGAEISSRDKGEHLPLAVSGQKLTSIEYTLPIPSAQVKSAILLAGLTTSEPTTIYESRRSRDHTERMFEHFGIAFERKNDALSRPKNRGPRRYFVGRFFPGCSKHCGGL